MGDSAVQHDDYSTAAPLLPSLEVLLPGLASRRQWMPWRAVPKDNGKTGKPPIDPHTGGAGKHNDPGTWGGLEEARGFGADGVGFTLSGGDPFCVVDLDNAIDEDGALTELAGRVLDRFRGAYVELSPSERGLHIIFEGRLPGRGRNSQKLGLEVYDRLRFVTVTGAYFGELGAALPMQEALDWLLAEFFPEPEAGEHKRGAGEGDAQMRPPAVSLTLDDEAVLRRARSAKNGPKLQALEAGNWGAAGFGSRSEADLSLCQLLAFYTKDAAQIDRLFRASGLMRGKWDEQHGGATYGAMTVQRALETSTGTYSGRGGRRERRQPPKGKHKGGERGQERAPEAPAAVPRVMDRDTHGANAERLTERHGHELRYVPGLGWLYFNGRFWEANERRAKALAKGVARYVEEEIVELSRQAAQTESEAAAKPYLEAAKALRKWRRRCEMYETVAGTLGLADDPLALDPEKLDRHDTLLNVLNGTLDLGTGGLKEHDPADLLTRVAPVVYDPGADCPRWGAFVEEVMPDPATRRELQKLAGYTLSGDTGEQKMAFLFGVGSNGKSTYLEVLQRLLGPHYARQAAPELLMASNGDRHGTERAMLMGARLVVCSEAEQGRRFAVQTLKELTGETRLTGRFMRQDHISFPIHFTVYLMANHRPDVRDTTHSFWRRLLMFPFTVQFDPPDLGLREALLAELPGVLNWCLEGHQLWRADGGLRETEAMAALKREYREESDELGRFLEDCCTLGEGLWEQSASLHQHYTRVWCDEQGVKKPMGAAAFKVAMAQRGLEPSRQPKTGLRGFRGVRLGRTGE